jgi:tyrosyl-tRNA synthetase
MNAFDTLVARGFVKQVTDEPAVRAAMAAGPVTFYLGIDPTADSMHVGHLLPVMASAWLQRAGHRPILVVGGGTARVGDPSGKTELRQMLTGEQIGANTQALSAQLRHFLQLDGESGLLVDNADWLLGWHYIDFLREIGRHFSVNRMLTMDSVKLRLERGLSFIEFNYQLLQAYDFLELHRRHGCALQIGGDDQWGNIVAGIDLIRRVHAEEHPDRNEPAGAWGLTLPLITTASGAKMGKTAEGAVWLDANRCAVFDYFQYWINVDDRDVGRFLRLYTFLPLPEIERLEALQGADIREAKRVLAREATTLVHGAEAAARAEEAARAMVGAQAAESLPTAEIGADHSLKIVDLLVAGGLAESKSEARRAVQGGAIKLDGEKVDDFDLLVPAERLAAGVVLRFGKKKAVRLITAP